nr:MAG TPA: hypothetical protein [Caudoviricetes sp.]
MRFNLIAKVSTRCLEMPGIWGKVSTLPPKIS